MPKVYIYLHFLSGFIHKQLLKKEQCLSCHNYLENCTIRTSSKFLDFINRGTLYKPNSSLTLVVKIANSCFLLEKQNTDILQQKKILQRITTKVLRVLDTQHPKIFSQLDTHVDPQNMFNCESHKTVMLKKIVSSYISIRLKHYCKEYNENFLDKKFKRIALKSFHFQG